MSAETVTIGSQSNDNPAANTGLNFKPATFSRSANGAPEYGPVIVVSDWLEELFAEMCPVVRLFSNIVVSQRNVFTTFCMDTPNRNPGIDQAAPRSNPTPAPTLPVLSEALSGAT